MWNSSKPRQTAKTNNKVTLLYLLQLATLRIIPNISQSNQHKTHQHWIMIGISKI